LKTILIVFLISLLSVSSGWAASPALNFSDLTNGPASGLNDGLGEGAIVTIWGNNLGSSQSTSTITIGGAAPAHIYYWKDADGVLPGGPADLNTYHQMQEIAFSIPASLANGSHNIQVTVSGETSNTLPFLVRSGNIYHAKTTGSSSGDGSFGNPWGSWITGGGLNGMSSGDILYLYNGTEDITTTKHIVSGQAATINNQFSIITYPNSRYLLQADEDALDMYNSNSFTISKLTVKSGYYDEPDESSTVILGKTGGGGLEGAPYGRLIANEITDIPGKCSSGYSGAIVASCGGGACDPISGLIIFGNHIHDWGCNQTSHFEHTTYLSIRNDGYVDVDPWEIGWNLLKDNKAKYGIHNYDESYDPSDDACGNPTGIVKIHDNYVINQKGAGINVGAKATDGYTCWDDTWSFEIYNNVIIESGKGPEDENGYDTNGIRIGDAGMTTPVKLYNNTIYGWGDDTVGAGGGFAFYETNNSGQTTVTMYNNIVYDTRGNGTFCQINETTYGNITGSNNLFYSSAGLSTGTIDSRLTGNILFNPLFVSATDLQLQSTSPAVNAGVTGIYPYDFLSLSRPQGSAYDVGAYEYVSGVAPPVFGNNWQMRGSVTYR